MSEQPSAAPGGPHPRLVQIVCDLLYRMVSPHPGLVGEEAPDRVVLVVAQMAGDDVDFAEVDGGTQ